MEAVTILRELWRRRILVGVAALIALFVGLLLTYTIALPPKTRKYEVGIANGRILVDTPDSQVVDVAPRGSDTLGVRANLLANLMTEGEVKERIAADAGLAAGQLRAGVEVEGELPVVLASAAGNPNAHLLTTRLATNPDGAPLPMIDLEAQAPDAKGAVRLADAAVTGLRAYLTSKAARENVSDARRLRITGLGAPLVREDVRGPRRAVALGAAGFVFLLGCAAILIVSALARGWSAAAEQDAAREPRRPARAATRPPAADRLFDVTVIEPPFEPNPRDRSTEQPGAPGAQGGWWDRLNRRGTGTASATPADADADSTNDDIRSTTTDPTAVRSG